MDNENFLIMLETLEEIKVTLQKIRTEPLLVTENEIDELEYNLGIINEYAKQLKRRE